MTTYDARHRRHKLFVVQTGGGWSDTVLCIVRAHSPEEAEGLAAEHTVEDRDRDDVEEVQDSDSPGVIWSDVVRPAREDRGDDE